MLVWNKHVNTASRFVNCCSKYLFGEDPAILPPNRNWLSICMLFYHNSYDHNYSGWVTYRFSYAMRQKTLAGGVPSPMTFWNSEKLSNLKVDVNLFLLYLSNHRWKKIIYRLRRWFKTYEINQRLNLWAGVPIVVSSCPAAAHMYRWTLWTIHLSLVPSSRKNSTLKTKKIRNI